MTSSIHNKIIKLYDLAAETYFVIVNECLLARDHG